MLVQLQSKVAVAVHADGVSFERPDRVVRLRWPEPHDAAQVAAWTAQLQQLRDGPVPQASLAAWWPVASLCELGVLNQAASPAMLRLRDFHFSASFPLIDAQPLGEARLRALEAEARAARFSPAAAAERQFSLPPGLWRSASAPREDFQRQPVLSEADLVRLFATLCDAEQPLYPSAGALYPVALVVQQTDGTRGELVRFDAAQGQLQRETLGPDGLDGPGQDEALVRAGTRLWFIADLRRAVEKYGERAYRYALLECGHVAQQVTALLEAQGWRVRPFGGFDDRRVGQLLRLDSHQLVCHALGVTAPAARSRWVLGQETRYAVLGGHTLQYALAYGGRTVAGESIYGYGIALDKGLAELKALGELAERLALHARGPEVANSNGLAAHRSQPLAQRNAALELYERHAILRVWLCRLSPPRLALPASPEAEVLQRLVPAAEARLQLLDVTDPRWGVPAVLALAHGHTHGGLLAAGAAASSLAQAAQKALLELAKLAYFRRVIRQTALFDADRPDTVARMEDHERYYASERVAPAETAFLWAGEAAPAPGGRPVDLGPLMAACRFDDLSASGPDPSRWRIARARSDQLLPLHFGPCPDGFHAQAAELLGQPDLNRAPHPIN